jgi:hypothetical protein
LPPLFFSTSAFAAPAIVEDTTPVAKSTYTVEALVGYTYGTIAFGPALLGNLSENHQLGVRTQFGVDPGNGFTAVGALYRWTFYDNGRTSRLFLEPSLNWFSGRNFTPSIAAGLRYRINDEVIVGGSSGVDVSPWWNGSLIVAPRMDLMVGIRI